MANDNTREYGKRLIPQIMEDLARSEPDRIVYSLASFPDQTAHFRTISAAAFAKAVDKTAWFLHDRLRARDGAQENGNGELQDRSNKGILPIGYIGPRKLKLAALRAKGSTDT
jgi:hypothetical protein